MSKATPGLRKRGKYWHCQKTIAGKRIWQSTGETELEAAERYLAKLTREIRRVEVYGERIERTFDQAAARYVETHDHKRSLDRDIVTLKAVMPYLGQMPLTRVHSGTLERFIQDRKCAGISAGTIRRDLAVIRRVLVLASRAWRDEQDRPWLDTIPLLQMPQGPQRKPRPITWDEQAELLKHLPGYLAEMCLFALNTGCRDQEICGLRWDKEFVVGGIDAAVFIVTDGEAKNGQERIIVLNSVARSIIEQRRGQHDDYVFGLDGRLSRINNKAWRTARDAAGLQDVRVHDLRHTFGMRLRSAGVSHEDRQDLLGHKNGSITTHYSKAEIANLIACVELLCGERRPELALIRAA